MSRTAALEDIIRKQLETGDLSFADFMEMALYHPQVGYYARGETRVGKEGDYVTGPTLSPVFGAALARLVREWMGRIGDGLSTVVDIGCGDGQLIYTLCTEAPGPRYYGVDRSLSRIAVSHPALRFVRTIDEVPPGGAHLLISNELFDAFPFSRLVQREEHLHELWVTEREGILDWSEHEAPAVWEDYFAERGIELRDGQFADVSLEWSAYYADLCAMVTKGLIVTFDYGFPEKQLFDARVRRFGTAASYSQHRVSRDLLSTPGERDLTAHINFTDLIRTGERAGFTTLFFGRQAQFLLALGAADHPLLLPLSEDGVPEITNVQEALTLQERREEARRLILPDGIGEDIRVLVQSRDLDVNRWSFQRELFRR
jgi:SAM-dependent MidA family methyltransferase